MQLVSYGHMLPNNKCNDIHGYVLLSEAVFMSNGIPLEIVPKIEL